MTITLHWPQICVLTLYALTIVRAIRDHGKVDPAPDNAWWHVAAMALMVTLLAFGGFWS